MRKVLFFLLVLMFYLNSCVNVEKEYFSNGNIRAEYFLKDGKLNGLKKVYYESGKINWEAFYKNDTLNGIYREFSESGILIVEGAFFRGQQHGLFEIYYPNGVLKDEVFFVDGHEHGRHKIFYESGKLQLDAISHLDTTYYYTEYDSNGIVIEKGQLISIKLMNDTIRMGTRLSGRISVKGPQVDSVKVEFKHMTNDDGSVNRFVEKVDTYLKNEIVLDEYLNSTGLYFIDVCAYLDGYISKNTIGITVLP
jgi:hypothetical protein